MKAKAPDLSVKVSGYAYDWFSYPPEWDEQEKERARERKLAGIPELPPSDHLCIDPLNCPNKKL